MKDSVRIWLALTFDRIRWHFWPEFREVMILAMLALNILMLSAYFGAFKRLLATCLCR